MRTMNVIGCGKAGRALSRVWTERRLIEIRSVLNRSLRSGAQAVDFIGVGSAVDRYDRLEPSDLVMISASDESIEHCCRRLCDAGVLKPGAVVFHCSGALPSAVLEPARAQGAAIAGVHPVKSFADPAAAADTFQGTFCAIEGDPRACELLADLLQRSGAITFPVRAEFKTIYHAATVVVCNYLVALLEVGLRCFEKAGMDRETATRVMAPIVAETIANVTELGPVKALTGPIARGERTVVRRQCEALARWDEDVREVYQSLGRIAVRIAAAQGDADADDLAAIEEMLRE